MKTSFMYLRVAGVVLATSAAALGQQPGMSARQLFYQEPKPVAPPPPAPQPKPEPKPTPKVEAKKRAGPRPAPPAEVPVVQSVRNDASTKPPAEPNMGLQPIAIRYSLLKVAEGSGDAGTEVSPSSVFRSGDRVRLQVTANQKGYLYVINRGSSGIWRPLFPTADMPNNQIEGRASYPIPSVPMAFRFDEQSGEEMLFLIFSRRPMSNLDELIEGLRTRSGAGSPPTQIAKRLDDAAVNKLREVYSRDLIVEKVEGSASEGVQSSPGPPRKENAVFVAKESGRPNDPVVADVKLIHQ